MADVNALYPKPPGQTESILSGDPMKMIGIVNALQTMSARKGIGEAYQKSIQPDGSIDTPALMREIQSRPEAAFLAGEASAGALSRQGQQIQNATALFEQKAKQNQFVVNGLGTLADKKNPTMEDVRNFVVTAARNTDIPSEMLSNWASTLPRDPSKLKAALVDLRKLAIGSAGLSTEAPIGITPEGAPIRGTAGQFIEGAIGAAPAAPPLAPRVPGAPQAPVVRAQGIQTDLAPAARAAAGVTGQGAGEALATARNQSVAFPNQIFPLEQAIDSLERLGTRGTGPGSETLNHIKSFALTMGVPGVDEKGVVDFDKAKKYLTDFVNQTGNSGTNDKLAAAFAGNPSVNIANASAIQVAKAALSLRRSQEARIKAFEDAGLPETDFAKFAGKWNREHDVRVFGWDLMTPDQRRAVMKDMPQGKRDLFQLDVEDAEKFGVIRPPRILPPTPKK